MFPLLVSQFETGGETATVSRIFRSPSAAFSALLHSASVRMRIDIFLISSRCSCACVCCAAGGHRRWSGVGRGNRGRWRGERWTNGSPSDTPRLLLFSQSSPLQPLSFPLTALSLLRTHTSLTSLPPPAPHVVGVWERRRRRLVSRCVCCSSVSGRRRRCGRA